MLFSVTEFAGCETMAIYLISKLVTYNPKTARVRTEVKCSFSNYPNELLKFHSYHTNNYPNLYILSLHP